MSYLITQGCKVCGWLKKDEEFYRCSRSPTGRGDICKKCDKERRADIKRMGHKSPGPFQRAVPPELHDKVRLGKRKDL